MNERTRLETIARTAGNLLRLMQKTAEEIRRPGKDIVLNADYASEGLILNELGHWWPTVGILSEEAGGEELREGELFIVDPLDGTNNYGHQDPPYGVSIGRVRNSKPNLGVVYLPAFDQLFSAVADKPATVRKTSGKRQLVHVSRNRHFNRARVSMDTSLNDPRTLAIYGQLLQRTFLPPVQFCATGSAMQVAMGSLDGYFHPAPKPFDVAAAGLIIKAAGGKVTDGKGRPWHVFSGSFVASNGLIHDQLLQIING